MTAHHAVGGPPRRRRPIRLRLSEVPVRYARRAIFTMTFFVIVLVAFLFMVHEMVVAAILGAIIGAYLLPVYEWICEKTNKPIAAVTTITLLIVPAVALLVYGYAEIWKAAKYLEAHTVEVADKINAVLARIPFGGQLSAEKIESGLAAAAQAATQPPAGMAQILSEFAVDASVFLFTAFYVLTRNDDIIAYLRGKVPNPYARFAERLEEHVQGVLYGAVYASLITQILKALIVLAMNLAFGVPLAVVLALLAFVIGFFPVVGSWAVYVPVAGYLLVFQNAPWKALAMLVIGFVSSTIVLSLIVRPKLAAEKSYVLNFYWMFIGLVAGVYTFGLPGLVLGPVIVGLLKAVFDTITGELDWMKTPKGEGPKAKVFEEEAVKEKAPPPEDDEEEESMEERPSES
jgi:predicted PurR-regulated permease PerM